MTTWYVIAAQDGVRIVEVSISGFLSQIVDEFDNVAGRKQNKDLESDRPGRSQGRGSETKHALGQQVSAHEHELELFLRKIKDYLSQKKQEGAYTELILVAESRMLGLMRTIFAEKILCNVKKEVPKNLYHLNSLEELENSLGV